MPRVNKQTAAALRQAVVILRRMEREYDKEGHAVKVMWAIAYRKAAERALAGAPSHHGEMP